MRFKKIYMLILLPWGVISCGPSEIELGLEKKCNETLEGIISLEDYWSEWSLLDFKSDEDLSIAYRDEIRYLLSEIQYYREVCEEVEGFMDYYLSGTFDF